MHAAPSALGVFPMELWQLVLEQLRLDNSKCELARLACVSKGLYQSSIDALYTGDGLRKPLTAYERRKCFSLRKLLRKSYEHHKFFHYWLNLDGPVVVARRSSATTPEFVL